MELYDALPVPSYDTPLSEVLEFKARRTAELLALRSALDELYQGIVSSADVPHARNATISRLEATLADMQKASRESFASRLMRSFKVELNVPNLLARAAEGSAIAAMVEINPIAGGAIGAASAAMKFDLGAVRRPQVSHATAAFAYLCSAERELK